MSEDKTLIKEEANTEIAIVDESSIRDKIYEVRGMKVMLDYDLAEIYGYSTKAFNQQVKRNIDRFPEDFMFRLTIEEAEKLSRSQIVTLNREESGGRGTNIKYAPNAFTESGIYMLMTVLKGDLAVRQSQALIRTFRAMKDYIVENQGMVGQREYLLLSMQVTDSIRETLRMRKDLDELSEDMKGVLDKLSDVVTRSEIAPILLELGEPEEKREYLFLDGQPMKADAAYISIYSQAKQSIHIVDDYINTKTLHPLQDVNDGVSVVMISDNNYGKLKASDYADFQKEFPNIGITFLQSLRKSHDRFIVLDLDTPDERAFHCGASSKGAGNRASAIIEFQDKQIAKGMHDLITDMINHPALILK